MFKNLKEKLNMLSSEIEDSKTPELLDMKNAISMVKNTLDGFNSRLDTTEVRKSKVKYITIETIQKETHREKRLKVK